MKPGTDKLLAKAARAVDAAAAALDAGAADVAAARAFYAILNAAKARLNESGLRLRSHARIATAYAALPELDRAAASVLSDALVLRARVADDPDGLDYGAASALAERAHSFVAAVRGGVR